jgi:glycosyltransferase involved in cell wall biosynthesis
VRIGIDARLGFGNPTGLGIYTRRLVEALAAEDRGNEYVLYVDRPVPPEPWPENFRVRVVPGRNRIAWINLALPRVARVDRLDLFHSVANFEVPLRFAGLQVMTVHDLVPLRLPETVPRRHRWLFRGLLGRALARADRVIAVSQHTRDDLLATFPLSPARVEVVRNWAGSAFAPGPAGAPQGRAVARRLGLGDRYLVFVGVLEPKKNLERLVDAFALLPAEPAVQLALVGAPGWFTQHLRSRIEERGLAGRVLLTGFVPEADLVALLQGARALVFPSLHEGFGLPVLEAMACGTAVVTARAGALPEVVGDAGLLVDPLRVEEIAAALARVVVDDGLVAELGRRGLERARAHDGAAAARRLVSLYLELFNTDPAPGEPA